ncbi:hypothetical protein HMPREF0023_1893 [Acinetobacter sp. ATCC 27244]|nr:hypothetical protein HMPREF0023_1893 [Acinetobacter sp. ATCC 27244]
MCQIHQKQLRLEVKVRAQLLKQQVRQLKRLALVQLVAVAPKALLLLQPQKQLQLKQPNLLFNRIKP